VLCMGIICVSVCIPNCCSMSAFHKSTWRCYSSYSYMNCIFAFLFLILRPLFRYTKCKVECCAPLQACMKKYTYSMCLFVCLFECFGFLLPQLILFHSLLFFFVFLLLSSLFSFVFDFFFTVLFYFPFKTMSSD